MIEQSERSRHLIEISRRAMHRGHDAWAAFNLSDKVTVALVLNRADWLEEFGCTPARYSTKGYDAARQSRRPRHARPQPI
jgi:hypothetical protein